MAKKKKQEIDLSDVKTVRLEINFSVPKEQFDELLRRMAHIAEESESQEQDKEMKEKKKD